ncbi:MAG: DUF4139 domain-containing protein [Spirochaetia bacterium]|nr:DUF4139 domain-containing protein [Spirochaetota bacterium]MCX8097013.1 DUF4139 domain-containing protein [Spirochaetota bacterium]MDW8111904.1 DUF4139 domain-containing protein [Spirochaetia bacterium]
MIKVFALIFTLIPLLTFGYSEFTFYKDVVLAKIDIKTNVIIIPDTDLEFVVEDNTILGISNTNYVDARLVQELSNVVNSIRVIEKRIKEYKNEIYKHNDSLELIKIILGSGYQKDTKYISQMVEEYKEVRTRILKLESEIESLEEDKKTKEEMKLALEKRIEETKQDIKVIYLSKTGGVLYFKFNGSWNINYTLDVSSSKLLVKVLINLPSGLKMKASRIVFTTFPFTPNIVNTTLPKLIGYLYEVGIFKPQLSRKMYKMQPQNGQEELSKETIPTSENIQESFSDVGIVWEYTKDTTLENGLEITIFSNITLEITKKYMAIPQRYQKGFLVLNISNTSELTILPGRMDLIIDNKRIEGLYISSFIPKNLFFETDGVVIDGISVRREIVEERTENPKFLGTNKRKVRVFKNIIDNNLPFDVDITIVDRIPIPSDDRIKIGIERITPTPTSRYEEILKDSVFNIKTKVGKGKRFENTVSYWIEYPTDMTYGEYER